ncbi:cadherin-like protein 26 isoform X5 [Sander lucioperca]|uniref:cadherin-like protein 26 isoform X5 n=1 Tax=Sander lucioperca TaxID=283035 RepID=UPI00125DBE57|nr:cadherin-like protein 26 isoform X5 [Sander lucioperca]
MKNISLLLLVALTALTESRQGYNIRRDKRELLVRSKRRWVLSTIEIIEENKGPFPKEIAKMYNDQTDQEGQIYRISVKSATGNLIEGVFSINESTGLVYVHQRIDREEIDLFKITFDILSKKTRKEIDKRLAFDIQIKDINDNAPTFIDLPTNVEVKENTEEGFLPVQLKVMDRDETNTPNSEITIRVVKQTPAEPKIDLKMMNDGMAQLTFTGCFDYDKVKKYEVTVEAKDHGSPSLSSTAVVTLNVVDSNSHPPTFKEKKYQGEVLESVIKDDILRIAVDDKDTPKTPGWRAKYYFIEGNQEGNYKIETDPATNEGILSVIKGKDFEVTTTTTLRVGVANEEPLFVCKSKSTGGAGPPPDTVNITIKVIDANDPPNYEKDPFVVYQKEEEVPGKVLFTPKVKDVDSDESQIRHMIIKDPAGWVTIDEKTGTLTTTKKMDRESPFVDDKGIYKIIVGAKDNGEPPATGTCTVLVHLRDINDNVPKLVNKELIMCGNKGNMVMVSANDTDADPYSGPFAFSLGGDDKTLTQRWKLDPAFVLLLLFICQCGGRAKPMPMVEDEGNQTLIKYNQEAGGSECKAEPTLLLTPRNSVAVTDGLKLGTMQMSQAGRRMAQDRITYDSSGLPANYTMTSMDMQPHRDTLGSQEGGQTMYSTWTTNRVNTYQGGSSRYNRSLSLLSNHQITDHIARGGSSRYNRSLSLLSNHQITDHIARRLHTIDGKHVDHPVYLPYEYAFEGQGSQCQSLDSLSLSNLGDDLMFLNNLGPKFKTLGGICHQTLQGKNIQL